MIKIGLVGLGKYGLQQLRLFKSLESETPVKLFSVCDKNKHTLKKIKKEYEVKAFDDFDSMLEKQELDAISVATPDYLHYNFVIKSLKQGLHVLCEKPLDINNSNCVKMVNLAKKKKLLLQVDFHKRFDPPYVFLRNELQAGNIGKPVYSYAYIEDRIEVPLEWIKNWVNRTSPLWFLGIHYIDLITWITGLQPKTIFASQTNKVLGPKRKTSDSVNVKINFEKDFSFTADFSWILPNTFDNVTNQGLRLATDRGLIEIDGKNRGFTTCIQGQNYQSINPYFILNKKLNTLTYSGYGYDSLKNFVSNTQKLKIGATLFRLKGTYPSGEEAARTTKICSLIEKSAKKGKQVSMK